MDFFEAQDRAKQATWKLLGMYTAAVVLIILSIYVVSLLLLGYAGGGIPSPWQPGLFFFVTGVTLILIISGTLFRIAQLRKGGSAVAEMLGGRKLDSSTSNPAERQLINIVEEMSIASGIPVPEIYLLDNEENINAFAAGLSTDDAAVGVTRGCLEQLNRDELQGVIAHEFSHIFNGDMRLNIRLIGILNGILLLHIMGMILLRSTMFSGGRRRSSNNDSGKAVVIMLVLGIALIIIGYIGMLFGRMIQAAVSRQREYLADAAAVQYTRNPDGIAGALEKIGRIKKGGEISDGHSMELSHLFFASSFSSALDRLFATHPPLDQRIEAIRPGTDKEQIRKKERIDKRLRKDRVERQESASTGERQSPAGPLSETLPLQEILLGAIGTMDRSGVDAASVLIRQIPDELRDAAHEPFRAEALIYALLLARNEDSTKKLPDWCSEIIEPAMGDEIETLLHQLSNAPAHVHLPLAEISIPALRQMSESQYGTFRQNLKAMVEQDDEITLFEFALEKLVEHRLDAHFDKEETLKIRHHNLKPLGRELSVVLSSLAHTSDTKPEEAWKAGLQVLDNAAPENSKLLSSEQASLSELDKALTEFAQSANPVKRYLMKAMVHCVMADDHLSKKELNLLRAIAESIGTPIPLHVMPTDA